MKRDHHTTYLGLWGRKTWAFAAVATFAAAGAAWNTPMQHESPAVLTHEALGFVARAPSRVQWEGREKNNVILVVIDGARAQDVFDGADPATVSQRGFSDLENFTSGENLMPELHAWLRDEGTALGAPSDAHGVFASGPNYVSLPGYLEILTGHAQPGCQDNECGSVKEKTILDEARERAGTRDAIAAFASWPILGRAVAKSPEAIVISAGIDSLYGWPELKKTPALLQLWETGRPKDPFPGLDGYRPDTLTARLALAYIEARTPRLTFLALGDTDEYAHKGDYRGYIKALHQTDSILGELRSTLRRSGEWGKRTTVLITTDHGRANDFRNHGGAYPESARSFVIALGGLARQEGIITTAAPHRLADIAPTVRHILRLPARDLNPQPGTMLAEAIVTGEGKGIASHDRTGR